MRGKRCVRANGKRAQQKDEKKPKIKKTTKISRFKTEMDRHSGTSVECA